MDLTEATELYKSHERERSITLSKQSEFPLYLEKSSIFWILIITLNSVQTLGYIKVISGQCIGKEQHNHSLVLLFQNLERNQQDYELLFKDYQKNSPGGL